MMRSTSDAWASATRKARWAALTAMSEVASLWPASRRSSIPVREEIHSWEVSRPILTKLSLGTIREGRCIPQPSIWAYGIRRPPPDPRGLASRLDSVWLAAWVLESAGASPFMALPPVLEVEGQSGDLPGLFGGEERGAIVIPAVDFLVVPAVVSVLHAVVDVFDDPAGGVEQDFGPTAAGFGLEDGR